jgi:hypothetical protein
VLAKLILWNAFPKKHQQEEIIGLPHLDLRLTIGVDFSSVEEVATCVEISLLGFVATVGE